MGGQAEEKKLQKSTKHICAGLLAHVDAGKTTLAEGMLYTGGELRTLGRVDHGSAFLDNFSMERERGITIFSKQARITWEGLDITLLDTPGHVDFSAEMERTLQVLDYAILVISGTEGVQSHVQTLWKLLGRLKVPVFLFVNKMDRPGTNKRKLLKELQDKLGSGCQEFGSRAEDGGSLFWEEISLCHEGLLEEYLAKGSLDSGSVAWAVRERLLFPCYFGSALRLEGVEELLCGIRRYALCPEYPEEFGARVYKISRDESGVRLTHLKVTGGVLRVKMPVGNGASASGADQVWEDKADQLRIYSGAQYSVVNQVEAGRICAVAGLDKTFAGQGLGRENRNEQPVLVPVLSYGVVLPEGSDEIKALEQLRRLEEEEPQLHVVWIERKKEDLHSPRIHVQVMGEVQTEILKRQMSARFGLEAEFTDGRIVYKETIAGPVVGIGHFEPLRHYAEVHLLLEPGEPGSGMQFDSCCSQDVLDGNWQRLVLTHLKEKSHPGVLTGAALTDMKITLLTGRAHIKHTEGGDFRQATYRAVRQGLMRGESVLLEPVYSFRLEVPKECLGRAMSDIQRMSGHFDDPVTEGQYTLLTGSAPAVSMGGYQKEVLAYTRGLGRLACELKGYEPCHNAEEVIARAGYDPDKDLENPSCSVFCSHGAGEVVNWDRVPEYAHLESGWKESCTDSGEGLEREDAGACGIPVQCRRPFGERTAGRREESFISPEEIDRIFQQTYGKSAKDYAPYRWHAANRGAASGGQKGQAGYSGEPDSRNAESRNISPGETHPDKEKSPGTPPQEEYLLVDGYNIIFAWEELRSLAERNINSARDMLMDICSNYQGFTGVVLILVFDAYKVKGNPGSVQKYHNIYVVYTREAETADQYIEKTVHKIGRRHRVTVATSDALEQMIIFGAGAVRLSARGFREDVERAGGQMRERYAGQDGEIKNRPFEGFTV